MTSEPIQLPLLTIREVAERLRVTDHTVRKWLQSGLLPYVRGTPRKTLVSAGDLDRFVREHLER